MSQENADAGVDPRYTQIEMNCPYCGVMLRSTGMTEWSGASGASEPVQCSNDDCPQLELDDNGDVVSMFTGWIVLRAIDVEWEVEQTEENPHGIASAVEKGMIEPETFRY
jgi:hypothetical protein